MPREEIGLPSKVEVDTPPLLAMVTAGAVTLVMVAVVLLGNSLIPPKWRGGACLMAGVCPDPENSPDPMGVPVNGWPNSREGGLGPGQCSFGPGPAPFPLPWGYPHVWQPSEMTGPGGPSDPRGPSHSLRKAAARRPWAGFVDP